MLFAEGNDTVAIAPPAGKTTHNKIDSPYVTAGFGYFE